MARIALAQINPTIGALALNRKKIVSEIRKAKEMDAAIVVFPEMALIGYPPEDLVLIPDLIEAELEELKKIIAETKNITAIVGCVRKNPYKGEKFLFNSAAILQNGELVGFQDKMLLPEYDVFSERRYFEPSTHNDLWSLAGLRVAVTICEDIWQHAGAAVYSDYPHDPVLELIPQLPDILINLSSSPFHLRKHETRLKICQKAARSLKCPVLLCNQVGGNDSLIFDGYSMVVDQKGELLLHGKGFEEDFIVFDTDKTYKAQHIEVAPIEEIFSALVLGVRDYFQKLKFTKAMIGLSGGVDSSVVACIAKAALGKENVLALSMSSRFTSQESKDDARFLALTLGIELKEVPIEEPFESFLQLLGPHSFGKAMTIAEENLQSRIRGVILMAFSNKFGGLVLATGNKSELAMGYSTLYGDMCGGLEVIGDVTKIQVYALAKWINRKEEIIPPRVLERAPSAELRPNQKDSDTLPEYTVLDLVLQEYIEEHTPLEDIAKKHGLPLALVRDIVHKIHLSEYKRRQAPPVLRVTKKAFSLGRRFPIVQHWNMGFKE